MDFPRSVIVVHILNPGKIKRHEHEVTIMNFQMGGAPIKM
jgi:hypothetical protein